MNPAPHPIVALVLNGNFAGQLLPLTQRASVWIVETPENRAEVERIWAAKTGEDVTSFVPVSGTTVQIVAASVENIDLHHGYFTYYPPYEAIEVIGAELSNELAEVFAEYEFSQFSPTKSGFIARKNKGLTS